MKKAAKSSSRVQEDFGVTIDALVELLVCVSGLIEGDIVRDDEGWLSPSGYDQVAEIAVIFLNARERIVILGST